MKRLVLVVAAAFAASCALADAREGLRHWWRVKDLNGDGVLQANEVYDAMTISAPTPLVGAKVFQSTDTATGAKPVCITNDVYMPTLRKTVSDDAIHFFNPTNYDENGKLQINYQAVQLAKNGSIGCTAATIVVRMKWDGVRFKSSGGTGTYNYGLTVYSNNFNPWNGAGWRVGLRCFDASAIGGFHPAFYYGNQEVGFHYTYLPEPDKNAFKSFLIYTNIWHDVVYSFRIEKTVGATNAYASVLYRNGNYSAVANRLHKYYARAPVGCTSKWAQYDTPVYAPSIGYHAGGQNPGWDTFGNAEADDGFNGSIHEIKVYDRCMTEAEMLQCLGGMDPMFSIGSANGSADEFSDSDAAAVYEPATMEWSRMRKTLNSSTPSASIRWDLDANNLALPRLVEVRLLKDTPFSHDRIRLDLNGSRVGRWTIPADGIVRFFIPARKFSALAQDVGSGLYPLTLTLTREGAMSGDIRFDSLTADGAWQLGANNNASGEFASGDQSYHAYNYFVGQNDLSKLRVATLGSGAYVNIDVHFGLGAWLAANCDYKLTIKSVNGNASPMNLYVNDFNTVYDSVAVNGLQGGKTWTLPAGTLLGSGNFFRIKNTAEGGSWNNLDYVKLEPVIPSDFKNSDDGVIVIVK